MSSWGAAPIAGRKRNHSHFRDDDDMNGSSKRGNWIAEEGDPEGMDSSSAAMSEMAAASGGIVFSGLRVGVTTMIGVGVSNASGAGAVPASPPSQWRSALQNAIAAASEAAGREAAVRADAEAALAHEQIRAQEALISVRQEAERAAEESRLLKRAVSILSARLDAALAEIAVLRDTAEEGRIATAALAGEHAARLAAEDGLRREAAARYATEIHLRSALDSAGRGPNNNNNGGVVFVFIFKPPILLCSSYCGIFAKRIVASSPPEARQSPVVQFTHEAANTLPS
jgi:hypothetical protein